ESENAAVGRLLRWFSGSREQCLKLLHRQVEGDGQHLQVDVFGAQQAKQGTREGLDDQAPLGVAEIKDIEGPGNLKAVGTFQHQTGNRFKRAGVDKRGKGMIDNFPLLIENGTADNPFNTVYVAQDVLH